MNHNESQLPLYDQLQCNSCHDDEHVKYEGRAKYEEIHAVTQYLLSINSLLGQMS